MSSTRRLFTLLGMSEATVLPFFPLLLHERGLGPAEIGLVLAGMALASFLANPVWGYAADRRLGAERAIVASAGGSAVLAALLLLSADSTVAFAAVACLFAGWRSPLVSLADAVALERLPQEGRDDYGRVRLWLSAGWAAAVLVWGAALEAGTIELLPVLYAGMSVAVALLAYFDLGGRARRIRVPEPHPTGGGRVPRVLLAFMLCLLLVNAAFAATWNFLALRILDVGGGAFLVGLGASLQAGAEVPVMRATPRLARRIGQRGIFVAGCLIYAVVFLTWGFLSDAAAITALRLIAGIGFALIYVGSVVIVDDLVPARLRATGQGWTKAISFGLAPVAGALLGGLLYEFAGARVMFVAASALAGGAAAMAWLAAAHARAREAAVATP